MLNRETILKTFLQSAAACEARIERDTEENRKGDFSLTVLDQEGNSCPGAKVKAVLRQHDFLFGANIFLLDELQEASLNEAYKSAFARLFNLAVAPFYWDKLEPTRGNPRFDAESPKEYRRPAPDLVLDFCEKNAITVKGHPLMWHLLSPDWLTTDAEGVKRAMGKRFGEISRRYADKIGMWDVVNESLKSNLNVLDGACRFGIPRDYVDYCFRLAETHFSGNALFINEQTDFAWEVGQKGQFAPYFLQIEGLLNRGRRIDGIGMQYHLMSGDEKNFTAETNRFLNPKELLHALDTLGEFGKPIHISEISVSTLTEEAEDEALQAEIVKYLYRLWFSHKNVESIIWWNLADGYAYSNGGGWDENASRACLLHKDMSPKPSYRALEELINGEWRTEASLTADQNGRVSFRGFYGSYEIEVDIGKEKQANRIEFPKNGLGKADLRV